MSNTVSSRKRQFFVKAETAWGTAVAPTNSDCVLMEKLDIQQVAGEVLRPDLTGDDGELVGVAGRRSCTWTASMSAALSGAAGTPPDMRVLLEAALGKAGVVVAATSVTYGLGNLIKFFDLYDYVTNPTTGTHQMLIGGIVNQLKITLGGDIPMFEFSGEGLWAPDSAEYADSSFSSDTTGKGGLSGVPTIPASPTVNGTPPPGFKMTATLDGTGYMSFRQSTITLLLNRECPKDAIGGYPASPADGIRAVTIDFGVYDDDSAALTILKQKALSKVPVTLGFLVGTTAGNLATYAMLNVVLGAPVYDVSGKRRSVTFNNSRAHDSTIGAGDAFSLVCT